MKLTTSEITFLARQFSDKTPISLLSSINDSSSGMEEKSLKEKDVLTENGLSREAAGILQTVAGATRCARVVLRDNFSILEKYTYRKDDTLVLVENDGGEMLFSSPENLSDTVSEYSEYTGMSTIRTTGIQALLPQDSLLVLLATFDLYRRDSLLSYMGQEAQTEVSESLIIKQLETPVPNSLVQMLKKNYGCPVPQPSSIPSILDKIRQAGYITVDKNVSLSAEYAVFARSLLIPECTAVMEVLNLTSANEIVSTSALAVCAGVKDIASFIFTSEGVELSAVSGMQLLQIMENFLVCPDIT